MTPSLQAGRALFGAAGFATALLALLTLPSCSSGGKFVRNSDYGECSLVLNRGPGKGREVIQLANLPFAPGPHQHEGLWCSEKQLQGIKSFQTGMNNEEWTVSVTSEARATTDLSRSVTRIDVKLYPRGFERSPRASVLTVSREGNPCASLNVNGEVFRAPIKLASGQDISLALSCRK